MANRGDAASGDVPDDSPERPGIVERYAETVVVRPLAEAAAAALAPGIGPIILAVVGAKGTKKSQERAEWMWAEVRDRLSALGAAKLDASFLDSDEFHDLFRRSLSLAVMSRARRHIRMLGLVVADTAVGGRDHVPLAESFVEAIGRMTSEEAEVLRVIFEATPTDITAQAVGPRIPESLGDYTDFILRRVSQTGFIEEKLGLVGGGNGRYHMTPAGWTLRKILGYPAPPGFAENPG